MGSYLHPIEIASATESPQSQLAGLIGKKKAPNVRVRLRRPQRLRKTRMKRPKPRSTVDVFS
jgi:hypothetical protein